MTTPVRFRAALVAAALVVLTGIAHAPAFGQMSSGRVSFLHLSADSAALDIYIDGGRTVAGLSFGETSQYLGLTPGSHKVQVAAAGRIDALLADTITVDQAASYTWVLSGLVSQADAGFTLTPDQQFAHRIQLSDNAGQSTNGRPRLRLVNASPGSGALDVRTDGQGPIVLAANLAFGGVTGYAELAPGSYSVSIYAAGGQTALASIPMDPIQAPNAYTLVLGGLLPSAMTMTPANVVRQFTPVRLTDQNALRSAPLTRGCNQVILNLPVGSPMINLLARVEDPSLIAAVWRFDNVLKKLQVGYFSDTTAPLDYATTVVSPEAAFICVSANTSWNPPG